MRQIAKNDFTYAASGDFFSEVYKGNGETHMSSRGIFPMLSTRPGVDVLLGRAAGKIQNKASQVLCMADAKSTPSYFL